MSSNPPNYQNFWAYPSAPPYESPDYTPSPPSQPQQFYPPPPPSQPQQYNPPPPPSQPQQYYPPPPLSAPYGGQPVCDIPVYKGSTSVDWSTGLFDCFDDLPSCIVTGFCPCITFGQIAEIVDKGNTSSVVSAVIYSCIAYFLGVPCVYSCFYRSKLRNQYRLHELPCADCPVHFFCECCALCQEYRELKNRGFDMSVGWDRNVEKQSRELTMPPMAQGMTR